jgi:hypothetical protein
MIGVSSVCQTAEMRHREFQAKVKRWRRAQQVERSPERGRAGQTAFHVAVRSVRHLLTNFVAVAFGLLVN